MFLVIFSLTAFNFSDLNNKMMIFLSQTESTPKHFFRKKALAINNRLSVGGTLCNLKKAFDCVNRGTLVNKLELHIS
jgi:hypothetical protein